MEPEINCTARYVHTCYRMSHIGSASTMTLTSAVSRAPPGSRPAWRGVWKDRGPSAPAPPSRNRSQPPGTVDNCKRRLDGYYYLKWHFVDPERLS